MHPSSVTLLIFFFQFSTQGIHSRFSVLAFGGVLSFIAGILTFLFLPDCTDRPLATIAEEVEISRTKIINDSDLDFRDTSITSGFVANIIAEDPEDNNQSTGGSFTNASSVTWSLVKRLTDIVQRKTQMFFHPPSNSISKVTCANQLAPISVMMGSDVFEPVTGFVFKWDKAEPAVKISDFEKEMSMYWKPNNDPSKKKLNDKHLNSLNILYNIDSCDKSTIDVPNTEETPDDIGNDSSL